MIVDLFVLPGLCFQSLSTFYCRFHCRPLNRFGSVASNKEIVAFMCGTQTSKDEMNCRIKVWPLVWARWVKVAKPAALWFQTLFCQAVLQEHCNAKTILFSYQNAPMPNFLTTYVHHHSGWVAWTQRESLTCFEIRKVSRTPESRGFSISEPNIHVHNGDREVRSRTNSCASSPQVKPPFM